MGLVALAAWFHQTHTDLLMKQSPGMRLWRQPWGFDHNCSMCSRPDLGGQSRYVACTSSQHAAWLTTWRGGRGAPRWHVLSNSFEQDCICWHT